MGDTESWVKISRKLLDHWIWSDQPFSKGQAWVDMILTANYKDKKIMFDGKVIEVKRGTFVTSIAKLSERWDWDKRKVKRYLTALKNEKMLSFDSTTRCTTITIENYGVYQCNGTDNSTTDSITYVSDMYDLCTQHKKDKKDKKDKNNNIPPLSPKNDFESLIIEKGFEPIVEDAVKQWLDYKKAIKKPYKTEQGFKGFLTQVENSVKQYGADSTISDFEFAISNEYQGVQFGQYRKNRVGQGTNNASKGRNDWIDSIEVE